MEKIEEVDYGLMDTFKHSYIILYNDGYVELEPKTGSLLRYGYTHQMIAELIVNELNRRGIANKILEISVPVEYGGAEYGGRAIYERIVHERKFSYTVAVLGGYEYIFGLTPMKKQFGFKENKIQRFEKSKLFKSLQVAHNVETKLTWAGFNYPDNKRHDFTETYGLFAPTSMPDETEVTLLTKNGCVLSGGVSIIKEEESPTITSADKNTKAKKYLKRKSKDDSVFKKASQEDLIVFNLFFFGSTSLNKKSGALESATALGTNFVWPANKLKYLKNSKSFRTVVSLEFGFYIIIFFIIKNS